MTKKKADDDMKSEPFIGTNELIDEDLDGRICDHRGRPWGKSPIRVLSDEIELHDRLGRSHRAALSPIPGGRQLERPGGSENALSGKDGGT